jgi:SAM-dependent methyltransferase
MGFKTFFTGQARKPSGFFGRLIMSIIFDRGNIMVNTLMMDALDIQGSDRILEIGFGTGKFLKDAAGLLDTGCIEGIDFSSTMVEMAKKRNRRNIARGKVVIRQGDFEEDAFEDGGYDTVCSANTIYFWSHPDEVVQKIFRILKPGGRVVLTFEDAGQLEERGLDADIFTPYRIREIEDMLRRNGFSGKRECTTRERSSQKFHCMVAMKDS